MINYHKVEITIKMEKMSPKECEKFMCTLSDFLDTYESDIEIDFETNHVNGTPYAAILNEEAHLGDVKNGCLCRLLEPMLGLMAFDENCPVHGRNK